MAAYASSLWLLASEHALLLATSAALAALAALAYALQRASTRRERRYVRLRVVPYRCEDSSAEAIVAMFEALHKRLLRRWWRRLLVGQPSISLEAHMAEEAWLAVCCPEVSQPMVLAALRVAYPNCRLECAPQAIGVPPSLLRMKKEQLFTKRVKAVDRFEQEREPFMNRLLTAMAFSGGPAFVQFAMTPASIGFERHARRQFIRDENEVSRERGEGLLAPRRDRSMVQDVELRGGLAVQHRPLFFVDVRVIAENRRSCEAIAAALRAGVAENRLVERGTAVRHGLLGLYRGRVIRGEGNPLPCTRKGVFASTELAAMWQMPSLDFLAVPLRRSPIPVAPAPAGIMRALPGSGTLADARGPVSIHTGMRRQNTAVVGTVEQGKSSYLVASLVEDLQRPRCAVILLDPKGDAAEAALSSVPEQRTCTLLDFSHPTCGFNPLAVEAPADVIADYVVSALKGLFSDTDIRASSDRYLRNAIIAVLAYDRASTLWDAARLLSVGEEGYAYRARVGARVRELPELKEISDFFTAELSTQLADARGPTTAKLDAPVNKLARLLNSPSIKRVLLNDSLRVDFDRIIANGEVLVVKGALGGMGAGNTSVLMQLLVGMLDAALSRQQDLVRAEDRVAVALKVDEAPLVLNRGFAETMALKRSAGLETVACWQANAQWVDREIRSQLDALFAHRVYFATASVEDARESASLLMAQFSDAVRPRIERLSPLGHPDARLHLPKHCAIASWSTPSGRELPFVGMTLPLHADEHRLASQAVGQARRGGCYLADLSRPHWDRVREENAPAEENSPPREASQARKKASARKAESPEDGGVRDGEQAGQAQRGLGALADTPPASYRELVALDSSSRVRSVHRAGVASTPRLDERDLHLLCTIASFRHALSSQLHRRHGAGTDLSSTQRRLKRLEDAGLIERMQFHAQDGGGAPMCCAITPAGLQTLLTRPPRLLAAKKMLERLSTSDDRADESNREAIPQSTIKRDLHVAAWALALEQTLGTGPLMIIGSQSASISPPLQAGAEGRVAIGPGQLKLPGGRVPHGFSRLDAAGEAVEVECFETVRPALRLEDVETDPAGSRDRVELLIEMDDRRDAIAWRAKLLRYDHFLAGWSAHLRRYDRGGATPCVIFVCRDRSRARECARRADGLLSASRAYAGERPGEWQYPGRERILFAAERDVHERLLGAYALQAIPPQIRASESGRVQMRAAALETRSITMALGSEHS
jgi:Replication-relaxation